jgi:hypothetical protein
MPTFHADPGAPALPGRRRAVSAAAVAAALALMGLAGVAEAAFWLPADFGANDPRRVAAFGDSITSGVLGDGTCVNPDSSARRRGAIPPNFRSSSSFPNADGARSIIAAVNAMLPGVADQEGIRFVDVFGALNNPALFGPPDGLHPNQQGYDALGAAWQPAVDAGLDESLVLLARIYLLRVNTEHLRSGQVLHVDLTLADRVTGGLGDVYAGLLLPPGADAALGCEPGGSIAFVIDEFAELVTGCLSDAIDTAVPLYRGILFREPIPLVTAVDFWSLLFTAGYPPGAYTLFFAITHAGDPTRLSVWTTHAVDFVP